MRPPDGPRRRSLGSMPQSHGFAFASQRSTPSEEVARQLNDPEGPHWERLIASRREGTHFVPAGDALVMRVGTAPNAESTTIAAWIRQEFGGVPVRIERSPSYLGQRIEEVRGLVLTIAPEVYGVVPVAGGGVEIRSQHQLHPSAETEVRAALQDRGEPGVPVRFTWRLTE